MTEQERAIFYAACLLAAIAMGPDLKRISWFGRNHKCKS
jgi:hypothetical protein